MSGGRLSSPSKASGTNAGRARGDGGGDDVCCWTARSTRGEGGSGVEGGELGGEGVASVRSISRASDAGCERAAASGEGGRVVGIDMK
eukprot:5414239-Pleurochrysis_carterae.AAC.1